ncbi:MAG: response regulator [Candidatus Sericytochromatia bacterium]|nr:response regulator [Candidatus Sericytochromatia bacterium]
MKKILVVEDTKSVREEIVTILQFENFDVFEAENGLVGLIQAKKILPDLIVCDVLMPELDGFGLLTCLRDEVATSSIPFIFLTAKAAKEDMRGGMELGADDYITKPFSPEELVNAIRVRLNKIDNINRQNDIKFEALCENIVYSMPHEFITPLTAILGFSELLIDTAKEPNVTKIAEGINNSGKRLERLIQNFLVYAQIEVLVNNPQKVISMQSVSITNPEHIIKDVASFKAKQLKREKDIVIEAEDAEVKISTENLRKIIEELVDNALKFSPKESKVTVKATNDKDFYQIQISDHGRGMTVEQIVNIGSYMQFDRKIYEQQGMGLGLVISKRLIEIHDGSLTIDSEVDKGTTINIKLKSKPLNTKSKNDNYIIDYDLEMSELIQ